MPTMTRDEYDAGLDAICERVDQMDAPSPADLAACNEALARFKATAKILPAPAAETTARIAVRPPARAAAPSRKAAKRAARIAKAARESLTATAAARQNAPQAPVRELHEMSADELHEEAAGAYRSAGGVSPFWMQKAGRAASIRESAPPGVQQGPAGAVVPTVRVLAIPPPDPAAPLHNMSSEDWEAASAAWFADAARAGHPSPFWQAG